VSGNGTKSVDEILAPLCALPALKYDSLGQFVHAGKAHSLPCFTIAGPNSSDPIRVGIFAGIHGDEPAGTLALVEFLRALAAEPALAENYLIHAYPVCNPSGFEKGTRASAARCDLNREFWKGSGQPEVQLIERELRERHFHGLIQLHADDTSDGIYGFVRGHTLSENLLKPALAAAANILPRNINAQIDGFAAKDGMIYDAYEGILAAPPQIDPVPFELILETPHHAPMDKQVAALVAAMRTILEEYRRLISFAADL
jgi:murein peptide amidase A